MALRRNGDLPRGSPAAAERAAPVTLRFQAKKRHSGVEAWRREYFLSVNVHNRGRFAKAGSQQGQGAEGTCYIPGGIKVLITPLVNDRKNRVALPVKDEFIDRAQGFPRRVPNLRYISEHREDIPQRVK